MITGPFQGTQTIVVDEPTTEGTRPELPAAIRSSCVVLLMLVYGGLGCDRPTEPSALQVPRPPVIQKPPAPTPVPLPSGPHVVYVFDRPLSYPVREFTKASSYELYESGEYALRYADWNYVGLYHRDGNTLFFDGCTLTPQCSIGTFNGDELAIDYPVISEHSDYEDAVYRLAR